MYKKTFTVFNIALAILMSFTSAALAQPPMSQRANHADRNKDGQVDRKEIYMEKKWEQKQRSSVDTWWEKKADTDGDGKVDAGELSSWRHLEKERLDLNNDGKIDDKERRLWWKRGRSRVNTELEKKYDANSDGWLDANEAKELLKDRYLLIKTDGKAKVDTETEREYDTNGDGVIDRAEAKNLKEDLGID